MTKQYNNTHSHSERSRSKQGEPKKRFTRNKIDGVMGGVCAGIGDYLNLDPVLVRIAAVAAFFFLLGPIIIFIYIGFWMFAPSDNRAPYRREYRQARKAKRRHKANPSEPLQQTANFRDVKGKFRSLETRLQDLEKSITSSEWQLRRDFRDLES